MKYMKYMIYHSCSRCYLNIQNIITCINNNTWIFSGCLIPFRSNEKDFISTNKISLCCYINKYWNNKQYHRLHAIKDKNLDYPLKIRIIEDEI